jgi:hypothetical protein
MAVLRDWDDDEQLLADLHDALRDADAVPARFVEVGKAAFAWRTVDAELAELVHDSADADATAALAGTRAGPTALRTLSFSVGPTSIEVELTPDALQGQVIPPQTGEVDVQHRDGTERTVPVDEDGWFVCHPCPTGFVRLRLRRAGGQPVITVWTTL